MAASRFVVSGKVQGVFFRASARESAIALGLSGHARNLRDGRVEVVVSGPAESMDALARWLWTGSPASRVDDVTRELVEESTPAGFRID